MKICCDLFSSTLKFQLLTKSLFRDFKNNYCSDEIINTESKYFKKNKKKFQIYWGNRLTVRKANELPNLKWIHYAGTGMSVDLLRYAKIKKIKVTNTKRIFDNAVASTVLAFIFMLGRGIHHSIYLKNKKKLNRKFYNNIDQNLQNIFFQNILLVGYSNIAKKIAKVCLSLDMNILAIKSKIPINKSKIKFFTLKQLKNVVKKADYIINLLPYTKSTKNIFNREVFDQMKKNTIFINVGRGDTVNEKDLINAIQKKKNTCCWIRRN